MTFTTYATLRNWNERKGRRASIYDQVHWHNCVLHHLYGDDSLCGCGAEGQNAGQDSAQQAVAAAKAIGRPLKSRRQRGGDQGRRSRGGGAHDWRVDSVAAAAQLQHNTRRRAFLPAARNVMNAAPFRFPCGLRLKAAGTAPSSPLDGLDPGRPRCGFAALCPARRPARCWSKTISAWARCWRAAWR